MTESKLLAFAATWLVAGCQGTFTCSDDSQCVVSNNRGKCLAGGAESYCAFASNDCAPKLKWDDSASSPLRGMCVGDTASMDMAPALDLPAPDLTQLPDMAQIPDLTILCPMGQMVCNGQCYDLRSDPANCGACDARCLLKDSCIKGVCSPDYEWARWPMPNPVGGGVPNQASYDNGTQGLVVDRITTLTWQRSVDMSSYSWADAKTYCANLVLAGFKWRLPTAIELSSLMDSTAQNPPPIDVIFSNTPPTEFWTSSPLWRNADFAWSVSFFAGETSYDSVKNSHRVRCVRGE